MRFDSGGMANDELRDQIARIETSIEEYAKTLDGCRKAMLLSKVAIATGGIWILTYALGVVRFDSVAIVGAIAAIIGGVVIYGSNSGTSKEAVAAIKEAEALRT